MSFLTPAFVQVLDAYSFAMTVTMPIRTGRGLNDRLHWRANSRKKKKLRNDVHLLWPWRRRIWTFPIKVRLTRIKPSGQFLDAHDNLRGALKPVVDQIAQELGVDDGNRKRIRFDDYAQEYGPWGIRIEILENVTLDE